MPIQPFPPVTFTVIGKLPVWVGVPLKTPADDKLKPVGNVPVFKLKVAPPIAPVWVKVWLKAAPAVPLDVPGLLTAIVLTVTVTLLVELHPAGDATDRLYVVVAVTAEAVVGLVVVPERKVAGDHK